MIRKFTNVFSVKDVKHIKKAFNNIKSNYSLYPQSGNFPDEIYSYNILKEKKINKIHNEIIYPKVKLFNFLTKEFVIPHNIVLDDIYLEWSMTKDINYSGNLNDIQAVICNSNIKYTYNILKEQKSILKPNDILVYDSSVPITFKNNNISDLIFIHYIIDIEYLSLA